MSLALGRNAGLFKYKLLIVCNLLKFSGRIRNGFVQGQLLYVLILYI